MPKPASAVSGGLCPYVHASHLEQREDREFGGGAALGGEGAVVPAAARGRGGGAGGVRVILMWH
jgi:hypothetical protein